MMKKYLKLFFIVTLTMVFFSCAGISEYLQTESGQFVFKKGSRLAGIATGLERPEDVDKVIDKCKEIQAEKNLDVKKLLMQEGYKYLFDRYGSDAKAALIIGEISDLVGYIVKDDQLKFTEDFDLALATTFLDSFIQGLELAKLSRSTE